MASGPGIDAAAAAQLNRLRRRAERWTDLLVGQLAGAFELAEFAANPERARDFAADLSGGSPRPGRFAWPLLSASLQAAFRRVLVAVSPNADLNARIAASVLACFPAELFDGLGLFRSLWIERLMAAAEKAQGMIDELLAP